MKTDTVKTLALLPGGQALDNSDWQIGPVGHSRDSDLVEESNWQSMLASYLAVDPDQTDHEVHRFGHFAVGWIEEVAYRPGSKVATIANTIRAQLKEYPILDELAYSELEFELESENWHEILRELRRQVVKGEPDLERFLDKLDDDALDEVLHKNHVCGESDGEGWRNYSQQDTWDLITALRILEYQTQRKTHRAEIRQARRARKLRRGWA